MRILLLPVLSLLITASFAEEGYIPTSEYKAISLQQFTVRVSPRLLEHEAVKADALAELESQLNSIVVALPPEHLAQLRPVCIWMEWKAKEKGAAEFHPSRRWLAEHGYNPEKAGGIEINNARNFVAWSRADQPWMLMHELAHAYHHLVLGATETTILQAYEQARDEGLYDSVAYVRGGKKHAYAMNNEKEYFAELTEAWLGKNDYYPFTRKDLETHDPRGAALMRSVWGKQPTISPDERP